MSTLSLIHSVTKKTRAFIRNVSAIMRARANWCLRVYMTHWIIDDNEHSPPIQQYSRPLAQPPSHLSMEDWLTCFALGSVHLFPCCVIIIYDDGCDHHGLPCFLRYGQSRFVSYEFIYRKLIELPMQMKIYLYYVAHLFHSFIHSLVLLVWMQLIWTCKGQVH